MDVGVTTWAVTLTAVAAVYLLDFALAVRNPRDISVREAASWVGVYVAAAIVFGVALGAVSGWQYSGQFLAGYVTEYSLSVDNLFVFVLIIGAFAVPRQFQRQVLQLGILGALVLRFLFIIIGAEAIARFVWLFFVFGAFLLYTAVKLVTKHGAESDPTQSAALRLATRHLPTTTEYDGNRFVSIVNGRRLFTPLFVVVVALFVTDILFALDSIPAIFGLTSEAYVVFMANAFALMGLRQLYFLLHGLLDRVIYLTYGLAVILGFIGFKLVLHALHEYGASWAPDIGIGISLGVIVVTLGVTVIASLMVVRSRRAALYDRPGPASGSSSG